jgi:hypothetical protein
MTFLAKELLAEVKTFTILNTTARQILDSRG